MGLEIAIAVDGIPDQELTQAERVEVYECMGGATTYSIHYPIDISEGDITLLTDGRIDAGSSLSVLVPIEDTTTTHCLVKGPVCSQKIHLQHGGEGSWVEVIGADTSIVMDRETKSAVWANSADSDAVFSILGNYGYIPDVQTTNARHLEDKHALVQRDTDLRFVRRLAQRNGFLFWVTCDANGIETAHFKHPPLGGSEDAELIINLDLPSLKTLDITWDVEKPTSVQGLQLDLNGKADMDGGVDQTPQRILGDVGLKDITGDTRSVHVSAPADDAGDMQARCEGALIEADWFIRATCHTSLHQLGGLVRAHSLVNFLGAGTRHSGLYFVAGVRHIIDEEAHRMELELIRNGWGT
jgi:hypothetical protein